MLRDLRIFARYARRLPPFVRSTLSPEGARARVERQLREREGSFLRLLEHAVYANPHSVYRSLLEAAGVELGDARRLVADLGLEGALAELRRAGVYVTLDEFKRRVPVERNGVSAAPDDRAFDNPLSVPHYNATTSGSRGNPTRVSVDLELLEHEAAYHSLFRTTFELWERPFAVWRAIPPNASAVNNLLRQVKLGAPVSRWFNPHKPPRSLEAAKFALFTAYTVRAGRLAGGQLKLPEYCPPDQAGMVARWLADCKRQGLPGVLDTQTALGVRACLAAKKEGLDIAGSFFRFGGEPYTEAKARVVAESGCRGVCHYTMGEIGRIGVACGDQAALDDVHFLSDKLAVHQRERSVGSSGATVRALSYTSLMTSTPKLLINVESDDYGVLERRPCDCPFGELGMDLHLHGIRSHDKLTSDGNHFLGSDLITLVDELLPTRFGGDPTDYQLVEEEVGALSKVSVVIRPHVGEVHEPEVVSAVLDHLRSDRRNRLMADVWADSDTLRVVRREPSSTAAGKILSLHVANGRERARS